MSRGKRAKRRDELLDHPRIKSNEIAHWRDVLYVRQGEVCPLCGEPILPSKRCLDHSHSSGHIRGTLHSGCNALLGKLENNYKRVGMQWGQLEVFSPNCAAYLAKDYSDNPYHPSHRTAEEKRLSRNERAKKARVKKSEAKASKGYKHSPARRKMPRG